jgi:DnaJ domain
MIDYYEFLQISPHADTETIHRVYRFLATRLHPDNPESGNADMFHVLKTAYDVLSDPVRRAEYDAACKRETPQRAPLSVTVDFMDSMEGELNRRLAVLALLYFRRRNFPYAPEVPLAEVEARMGFPRDYLDFTTWYLQKKGYITRADNSDFTLTAAGVDFVETERASLPVLNKLLTTGASPVAVNPTPAHPGMIPSPEDFNAQAAKSAPRDRRSGVKDRRFGAPDLREDKVERRVGLPDRRVNKTDRRGRKPDRRGIELEP